MWRGQDALQQYHYMCLAELLQNDRQNARETCMCVYIVLAIHTFLDLSRYHLRRAGKHDPAAATSNLQILKIQQINYQYGPNKS